MQDTRKTKAQLVAEVQQLRARIAQLERSHQPEVERPTDHAFVPAVEAGDESLRCRLHPDATIATANEAFSRFFGKRPHEVVGMKFVEMLSERAREEVERRFADLTRDYPVATHDLRCTAPNGEFRWTKWTHQAILNAAGEILEIQSTARDTTQEKCSEDRLRLLSTAIEQSTEGIAVTDLDGALLFVNEAFARMHGYAPSEILHRNLSIFHSAEQLPAVEHANREIQETGSFTGEIWHRRRDGSTFPMLMRNSLVRDSEGKPVAMLGTARDFTEFKRAQDDLRENERALATLISNLPGIAYRCRNDPDWTMEFISEGCAVLTGYTREDIIENRTVSFADLIHQDDQKQVWDDVQRALSDKLPFQLVYRVKCVNGTTKWVWEQGRGVFTDDGELLAMEGFITDITERKQAEDELRKIRSELEQRVEERTATLISAHDRLHREMAGRRQSDESLRLSEQRLRTVVGASKDAIITIGENGLITLFNPAAEQMFQRSANEMIGQPLDALMPEDLRGQHGDFVESFFRSGEPSGAIGRTVELTALRRDGSRFPIGLSLSIGQGESERFALAVIRDITEHRRSEEALRHARDAAEVANRAKSSFLANMGHEIRTPITALLNAAELLTDDMPVHADANNRVNVILTNGSYLLSLIESLLDLSRLEIGRFEVRRTQCSTPEIITDIRSLTVPLHQRSKVAFRFICETPIPSTIHTDAVRLKQAAVNLINNALKFTKSGHVHVHMSVDREKPDPCLTFVVEDTGRGIPKEECERIFDAFAQVEGDSPPGMGGVGLGLPLARWIAEQLGGSVEVESTDGVGSRFTLRVATGPLDEVTWLAPDEIVLLLPSGRNRRLADQPRLSGNILVADDVCDLRELVAHSLRQAGATVEAVESGRSAVEACERDTFDLILMDVRMADMDGLEATAELRRRGCLTPIIAMTASTARADHDRILEAGFDDLWPKPMSLDRIVKLAAQYLGGNASADDVDPSPAVRSGSLAEDPRMASIVSEFVASLSDQRRRLHDLVTAAKRKELGEILHQLVGTAGVLGFIPLSTEAVRLQAAVRTNKILTTADLCVFDDLVDEAIRHASHETPPGG